MNTEKKEKKTPEKKKKNEHVRSFLGETKRGRR